MSSKVYKVSMSLLVISLIIYRIYIYTVFLSLILSFFKIRSIGNRGDVDDVVYTYLLMDIYIFIRKRMNIHKMISLSPWTYDKLKIEYNASELIDRLLREHYKYSDIDKKKEEDDKIQLEIARNESRTRKEIEFKENVKKTFLDLFEREMTEEELNKYINLWNDDAISSMYDFREILSNES